MKRGLRRRAVENRHNGRRKHLSRPTLVCKYETIALPESWRLRLKAAAPLYIALLKQLANNSAEKEKRRTRARGKRNSTKCDTRFQADGKQMVRYGAAMVRCPVTRAVQRTKRHWTTGHVLNKLCQDSGHNRRMR